MAASETSRGEVRSDCILEEPEAYIRVTTGGRAIATKYEDGVTVYTINILGGKGMLDVILRRSRAPGNLAPVADCIEVLRSTPRVDQICPDCGISDKCPSDGTCGTAADRSGRAQRNRVNVKVIPISRQARSAVVDGVAFDLEDSIPRVGWRQWAARFARVEAIQRGIALNACDFAFSGTCARGARDG